jgi:hypothetical protein
MEVKRENIDKAFSLAHRASEDARYSPAARAVFRAIAHQVWLACGKSRPTAAVIEAEQGKGLDRTRRK